MRCYSNFLFSYPKVSFFFILFFHTSLKATHIPVGDYWFVYTQTLMSFSLSIRPIPLFFINYTVENVDFEILFSFLFECFPHQILDHVKCSFKKIIHSLMPTFCVCSWFCVPLSNYAHVSLKFKLIRYPSE